MKNIKTYHQHNESILNLSKTRKFPTYGETNRGTHHSYDEYTDFYYIYHLNKKDIGKYLNTWFSGNHIVDKNKKFIARDEMWTVKKVDDETASHLYNRTINPIEITIMCPTGAKFKQNENGEDLYEMKATLRSIDDSSYGIWFNNKSYSELEEIRFQIMKWINNKPIINGDKFIEYCVSVGGDESSIDYN